MLNLDRHVALTNISDESWWDRQNFLWNMNWNPWTGNKNITIQNSEVFQQTMNTWCRSVTINRSQPVFVPVVVKPSPLPHLVCVRLSVSCRGSVPLCPRCYCCRRDHLHLCVTWIQNLQIPNNDYFAKFDMSLEREKGKDVNPYIWCERY